MMLKSIKLKSNAGFVAGGFLAMTMPALAMLPNPQNLPVNPQTPQANTQMHKVVHNTNVQFGTAQSSQPQLSFGTQTSAAPSAPATANTSDKAVRTLLNAYLVEDQAGKEVLSPISQSTRLKSGDIVEYRAYYTNQSGERIRSMNALLEIPKGVELVGGVEPSSAFATIDGQRFVRTPIRGSIGGQVQEVPLNRYKALRWQIEDVGINGTALVKFRARIQ